MEEHKIGNIYFFPYWTDFGVVCERGYGPRILRYIVPDPVYLLFNDGGWRAVGELQSGDCHYDFSYFNVTDESSRDTYKMVYPDAPWSSIPALIATAKNKINP